ncbi:hypothetical protein NMG60_11009787 [Bertholletia excelsa]
MATIIKGFYKGFKYNISQIFVVKEREMQIGHPTDVKHVAHIGWDGPSGSAPSWMNEFKTSSNFMATSLGNIHETRDSSSAMSTWSSQEFESMDRRGPTEVIKELPPTDLPKKQRRKKTKSSSSCSSSSRSSRATKSKAKFTDGNPMSTNVEVESLAYMGLA